jgi:hypothetical protein
MERECHIPRKAGAGVSGAEGIWEDWKLGSGMMPLCACTVCVVCMNVPCACMCIGGGGCAIMGEGRKPPILETVE